VKKENMTNYLASSGSFVYSPDFETRITSALNTFTGVGTTGNVICTLEYKNDSGVWTALAGKPIVLTRPDTTFISVVTSALGEAVFTGETAQRGTYTFDFAGTPA